MQNRRKFLQNMAIASMAGAIPSAIKASPFVLSSENVSADLPVIMSTWSHGIDANAMALKMLHQGGSVLDAVESGVRVPEADPNNRSVGLGGLPDRDGHVTLDACIMDKEGNAGSVCYLEHIVHPISVARLVMEKTPHVMLAGDGALRFALENGFEKTNLLTPEAEEDWKVWLNKEKYAPKANWENNPNLYHDTIGLVAADENGDLAGACTTSGLPYKMHGRVGDSPIIGAGLFVDNEVGAAAATGMGEFMMKTLGSFLVVELMRQGSSPQQACEDAVKRVVQKIAHIEDIKGGLMQVGYIAINKKGEVGAYSLVPGFNYALCRGGENKLHHSLSYYV